MRRKIAVVLSFIMVFVLSASLADASSTIDAPVTSTKKFSASEWYSTSQSRAALTVFVSIDTLPEIENDESLVDSYTSFWTNSSWVGLSKNKRQVMVTGYYSNESSTTILVCIYTPDTEKIEYMPMVFTPAVPDATAELFCITAIQNDKASAYEKNDPEEMMSIITQVAKD